MYRSVANKNGTIEVNGNTFRFSQPADEYKTDDIQDIEVSYSNKLEYIADDPHYITAQNIDYQNGQVTLEYDLADLKMFDHLRKLFFREKLYYYRSLIEIAKRDERNEISVLWHKDNFVVDPNDENIKTLIIEHDVFEFQEKKDTVAALKELIILSLTAMNKVLGKPRRSDFIEDKEEVIQFAEKVYLKAKSIEAIEEYVNAEILHMEIESKKEEEEKQKQGKFAAFSEKIKIKSPDKNRQSMISKLDKKPEGSPGNKKKNPANNNKFLLGVGGVILAAILLNVLLTNGTDEKQASADVEEDTEQLTVIYRDALLRGTDNAIKQLEEIGYGNLAKEDQEALNHLYIDAKDYETAIKNDPTLTGKIAKDLYKKEDVKSLEEFVNGLEEINHEASFYLELANQNWKQVIARTDEMDTLDNEQVNHVLTAFFQLGNAKGANEFLATVDDATEKMEERIKLANEIDGKIKVTEDELAQLEEKLDKSKKEDKEEVNKNIEKVKKNIESMKSELKSA